MARRLTPEQRNELDALCEKHRVMLRFFNEVEPSPTWSQFLEAVEQLAEAGDLRSARDLDQEFTEMHRLASRATQERLSALLLDQLGIDTREIFAKERARLSALLKRGRIRTRAEYDRIMDRLNDVEASSLTDVEREIANRMIVGYEERSIRRPAR